MPVIEGFVPSDPSVRRRVRDAAHRLVRATSHRQGARECLVDLVGGEATVRVDGGHGRAHLSGVKRCASPWACPHCSPKVRDRRGREITAMVVRAIGTGHTAWLLTVTVPHGADDALATVLDGLQASWRRMWSGRWASGFREAHRVVGTVRAIEVTWGAEGGWHPHIHCVLVLDGAPGDGAVVAMFGSLLMRWRDAVRTELGREVSLTRGLDLRPVSDPSDVSEYVTGSGGWSIGAELSASAVKVGRSSGRWSPFALLYAAATTGDREALDLWLDYERATAGKRAIVASRGLYARFGVDEVDDEEASMGEATEDWVAEVTIPADRWVVLCAVDAQTTHLARIEEWAAAGCVGDPPDPDDTIRWAVEYRAAERAR